MAGRTISTPQVLREQYEDYLRLKREELYRQMMSEVKTIAGIYERETDRLNLDRIRGALFTKIGELVAKHAA